MSDTRIWETADKDILILDSPILPSITINKKEPPVQVQDKLAVSEIFTITFPYLGQLRHTKVLKVTYSGNQSLYKVALSSNLVNNTPICWPQYQPQGWAMLFGQELDETLKQAITIAIECGEEPGLI